MSQHSTMSKLFFCVAFSWVTEYLEKKNQLEMSLSQARQWQKQNVLVTKENNLRIQDV